MVLAGAPWSLAATDPRAPQAPMDPRQDPAPGGLHPMDPGDPAAADPAPAPPAVWAAGVLHRVLADRDYPGVLAVAALNRVVGAGVSASPGELEALTSLLGASGIDGGASGLERCRALRDPVEGTLCSLETLAPLVPPVVGRELAEEGARLVSTYLRPGEDPVPGVGGLPGGARFGGEGILLSPFQSFAEEVLEEAWRIRDRLPLASGGDGESPSMGDWSGLLGRAVGLAPGVASDQVFTRVPGLRALALDHPALAGLEGAARDGQAILGEYRDFLGSVSASTRGFVDGAGGEMDPARGALEWAAQRSFLYLASRTASGAGMEPGVARRIQTLGNAAVDLHRESRTFTANLSAMGQQAAVLALSGNVFGLAAGVAAFFELTPGALGGGAAGEVRALREAVDGVRQEMEARFDALDVRLDEVFEVLDSRFATMETLVAGNHAQVQAELAGLQAGLTALARRLDRMESTLTAYLEAGFDRDYARTLVRCLEHRERHLPPFDRMEFPVFSGCLTEFRVRGAQDARDALLADRTTPVDDGSLAEALADLSAENLARRLPLLARAAEQRLGYPGLRGGRGGANPVEWAVASQAYLTMLQDWPDLARSVAPGDLDALLATGLEVQAILRAILEDPSTGEAGVLLERGTAHYRGHLDALTEEADRLARRHQQAQLRRVDPASLLTGIRPVAPDASQRPELPAPRWVTAAVPQEVRTAAVLALDEPSLVYRTMAQDSVLRENVRRRFLFGRRHDRLTFTRTRMEVELRLGDGRVVSTWRGGGPPVLRRVEEMAGGVTSDRVRSARDPIPDPEGHFLEALWPDLSRELHAWAHTPPRLDLLQELEETIEAELRRFESASLNRVFSAVCQGDAVLSGLDPADRDSALRMREALQGLTGARALLHGYVGLALPAALDDDPVLRDLLEGRDGLLYESSLCGAVAAGESALRVVWLEEEPRERARRLEEALAAAVAQDAVRTGTLSTVDATVQQLRAAIRIQQLRARVARGEGGVPGVGPG
jgi:hypothetical protein